MFLALYRSLQYYKLSLTLEVCLFLVLNAKCRGKLVLLQGTLKERTARQQIYNQPRHHIKKQRYYFANKGPSSQGYGFSRSHVWIESWTELCRTDSFELWFLRVPWTAMRSNQSILREISPGCSLEGLMLKWKLQYFGHLMQRTDSLEKTLMLERWKAAGKGNDKG